MTCLFDAPDYDAGELEGIFMAGVWIWSLRKLLYQSSFKVLVYPRELSAMPGEVPRWQSENANPANKLKPSFPPKNLYTIFF